jgi:hypothetical protein
MRTVMSHDEGCRDGDHRLDQTRSGQEGLDSKAYWGCLLDGRC